MLARSLAITLTTAAVLTAAPAAYGDIGFFTMPGYSGVEIDGDSDTSKLELVRGGTVIASSDEGVIAVEELKAGDVARAYDEDSGAAGSVTYDGTPAIAGACIGSSSFTVSHGPATVQFAGAFTAGALEPLTGTWDAGQPARVTLTGPLTDGDMVFVSVGRDDVEPAYSSTRLEPVADCSAQPGETPAPTPHPTTTPTPQQPGGAPKPTLVAALRASGAALAKAKLRARIALPFTLPERGRIELRVRVHGRTVARGSRTATGATKVTLKVSKKLKRGAKVTLEATFTPSRAGAKPQRASVKVTLTGSSSTA